MIAKQFDNYSNLMELNQANHQIKILKYGY